MKTHKTSVFVKKDYLPGEKAHLIQEGKIGDNKLFI